jgi:hypothetical protein
MGLCRIANLLGGAVESKNVKTRFVLQVTISPTPQVVNCEPLPTAYASEIVILGRSSRNGHQHE